MFWCTVVTGFDARPEILIGCGFTVPNGLKVVVITFEFEFDVEFSVGIRIDLLTGRVLALRFGRGRVDPADIDAIFEGAIDLCMDSDFSFGSVELEVWFRVGM